MTPKSKKTVRAVKKTAPVNYITLNGDEVNEVLEEAFQHDPYFDGVCKLSEGKLKGFTVKHTTDGDHKNDGQMVEYTFKFISPKRKVTKIVTEMCLMVGFNLWHSNKYKFKI
jgi:hypothetical protein